MDRTIREEVAEDLWAIYDMREEDVGACLEFAIQELNQNNPIDEYGGLEKKDGQSVKVAECWDTDYNEYEDREIDFLKNLVESKALKWYVKRFKALEDTLQEIHRLSRPSNEQGTAE
jgi:hypothetical protein